MNNDNKINFEKDLKPNDLCERIAEYILKIARGANYTKIDKEILSKEVSMHIIDIDGKKLSEKLYEEGNSTNVQPKENGK